MRRQTRLTQGLLSAVKRQKEPSKRDCKITIPFNQMYPERCPSDRQCNTTIESGHHDSQCSNVTVTSARDSNYDRDSNAERYYGSTVIDLGSKSVN